MVLGNFMKILINLLNKVTDLIIPLGGLLLFTVVAGAAFLLIKRKKDINDEDGHE